MNEPGPRLQIKKRNLPHWTLDGSTYFVTFRTARRRLSQDEQEIVFEHLMEGSRKFYNLASAVVMLDHVHLLLRPSSDYPLPRIMKGIKGVSSRKINVLRNSSGQLWQDEYWDRIVRDFEEFEEKVTYIAFNPVKAELVRRIEDYRYWYLNRDWY